MALKNLYDVQHRKNVATYQQMIDAIFAKYAGEMAKIGASVKGVDPKKVFSFADYPMTNNSVKLLLKKMSREMTTTILNGVEHEWTLANNKNNELCRLVFGDNIGKLTQEQYRRYFKTNYDAMEAFQKRRDAGLQLSDRVWNYTNQFKDEIEFGLDLGIRNGQDAASMARDLKQYLKYPDKLFRRVRNEHGQLVLSKAARAFHPSRGVYRSSFKNARRLAATETNIAYRSADHERWNDLDFVVGIHVQTSQTNHGEPDICDMLAGDYPKDFKFVGWHPLCRCYATPILKTKDELMDDLNDDEERGSVNAVLDVPQGFKDYVDKNSQRIAKTPKLPYFLRDNGKRDENGRYILKPLGQNVTKRGYKPTALDIAKQRHANRTKAQIDKIQGAWDKRKAAIAEGKEALKYWAKFPDGDKVAKGLTDALKHARYDMVSLHVQGLAELKNELTHLKYVQHPVVAAKKYGVSDTLAAAEKVNDKIASIMSNTDVYQSVKDMEYELKWVVDKKKYATWPLAESMYKSALVDAKFKVEVFEFKNVAKPVDEFLAKNPKHVKVKAWKAKIDKAVAKGDLASAKNYLKEAEVEIADWNTKHATTSDAAKNLEKYVEKHYTEKFSVTSQESYEKVMTMYGNATKDVWQNAPIEARSAVKTYTGSASTSINCAAGMGRDNQYVPLIDSILNNIKTTEDVVLRSGQNYDVAGYVFGSDFEDLLSQLRYDPSKLDELNKLGGRIGVNKAYMSTSFNKEGGFTKQFEFHVFAPKGTRCMNVNEISNFGHRRRVDEWDGFDFYKDWSPYGETEILLARNTKFKFIRAELGTGKGGTNRVYIQLLGEAE